MNSLQWFLLLALLLLAAGATAWAWAVVSLVGTALKVAKELRKCR